jgi:hypothetical protein
MFLVRTPTIRRTGAWVVCFSLLGGIQSANADPTRDACFSAYESAQRLRKNGELVASQTEVTRCASSKCPAFVTKDCVRWSQELERTIPSVVFIARNAEGRDLVDVAVAVDGKATATTLDGRAVALDPGAHTIRYVWKGKSQEKKILLAEAEKGRRVEMVLDGKPNSAPTDTAPADTTRGPTQKPPTTADEKLDEGKPFAPVGSLILGSVGVLGVLSFVGFGVAGKIAEGCEAKCTPAEVSTMRSRYVIADVTGAIGLVALGGAIVWWVLDKAPEPTRKTALSWTNLSFAPLRSGFAVGAEGRF